ncbi:F0F1 ATP synthase subunit B [Roseburia sp. BX1005]|jgi:ATP synthase F0, B subunit|uniref:ATP synthase subunit b n=1 Tax=Roseburia zhanii TaxID=2763064 RepID=A0A923RSN9_9FIRM|nr:F0F1 ATP synthase subunit B [Roseburia zhanii]MBC5713871.1 F0F1 ATP synthase subunit B [Roseburia zhanii]OLA80017.1 MAG: ATP synthase F0 subunit B [Roseburia sp. 40_7]
MDRLFGLDMQLLMDALQFAASVLVLFALGSYLLFNPVRKLLKDRQDGIKKDIDDAAADKESAKELKDLYEGKLKEVDKEAEQILSEARQKALKNEARIIDEAKEEAARIIKRANEEAVLEKKRAMDEVKQEMITIASMMAAKAVAASIDTTIQDTLVEETLKEMGDSTWQS